jgi:hypothetical protein
MPSAFPSDHECEPRIVAVSAMSRAWRRFSFCTRDDAIVAGASSTTVPDREPEQHYGDHQAEQNRERNRVHQGSSLGVLREDSGPHA